VPDSLFVLTQDQFVTFFKLRQTSILSIQSFKANMEVEGNGMQSHPTKGISPSPVGRRAHRTAPLPRPRLPRRRFCWREPPYAVILLLVVPAFAFAKCAGTGWRSFCLNGFLHGLPFTLPTIRLIRPSVFSWMRRS